ncbi:hypothetical protein ACOBR2_18145 [Telmatobacter bradus]|uniref:hypothetical protein n=1 Tax=Telmatobacter bradus TaxID=474953 RepID=UPI003B4309D0
MQVTVTISDEIIREAAQRKMSLVEFVENLIDQGMHSQSKPALTAAIDRIRALHSTGQDGH